MPGEWNLSLIHIFSAVYDVAPGEVWPRESLARLKEDCEKNGLVFDVVESIPCLLYTSPWYSLENAWNAFLFLVYYSKKIYMTQEIIVKKLAFERVSIPKALKRRGQPVPQLFFSW